MFSPRSHRRRPTAILPPLLALLLLLATLASRPAAPAQAQVSNGTGFASAVPCLSDTPTYATTAMANTLIGSSPAALPTDPALLQITSASARSMSSAAIRSLGALYGLAYDDGSVSGVRRIFAAAYLKRTVNLGPAGLGGIYEYRFADGSWRTAATVPTVGSVDRPSTYTADEGVLDQVGLVGLGDLELAPDGRTLYAMNLYTRQIERYGLSAGGALVRQSPISIPLSLISASAQVQADLRPFAIGFWPSYNPATRTQPAMVVGVVDSAARSARGTTPWTFPRAYVLAAGDGGLGSWGIALDQNLHTSGMDVREHGSSFRVDAHRFPEFTQLAGWNPWRLSAVGIFYSFSAVRYPQPLLTDLSFSRDGQTMYVGLRDRSGDMFFSKDPPPVWSAYAVMSQGDVLTYRLSGTSWQLQGDTYADLFDDNTHDISVFDPSYPLGSHIENFMGTAAISLRGAGPNFSEQLLATSLLGSSASGTRTYNAAGGAITGQQALFTHVTPAGGKATALGDVEPLCTYALAGGRVWDDADGDGVQDAGEPGIANVQLEVFTGTQASDPALASLRTDAQGRYLFAVPPNAPVNIRVSASSRASLAAGQWEFVRENQGGNDSADSDMSKVYGYIEIANPPYSAVGGGVTGAAVPMLLNRVEQRDLDLGLRRVVDTGQIGDRVWSDTDHDGVQDAGEPGVAGYTVSLEPDPTGMAILPGTYPMQKQTDGSGNYRFVSLPAGRYRVRFATPSAPFQATLINRGGSDAADSDADVSSGYATPIVTISAAAPGNMNTTLDLGLFGGTPDVWVSKSGPPQALVGTTFSYSLSYGNAGALPADGVVLVDSLPAGVSFVSASPAPSSVSGQTIRWDLGTLATGASGSISLSVRAPASIGAATSQAVTNQASISTSTANDPPGNNTGSSSGAIVRPEVDIVKTGPASALVGDEFSYTLAYANRGSLAAASVTIADRLPAGLTLSRFIQNPGLACSYTAASRQVSCSFPALAAGASGSVVLAVTADTDAASSVANSADISTATAGDDPANNRSTATTAVQFPNPGVGLSVSPAPFPVGEGGTITASYQNSGTGAARDASLSLSIPDGVALGGLPGGCSFSATTRLLSCGLGDLAAGASGSRVIPVHLPADFAADQLAVTAAISSATPERASDQADNTAASSTPVVRPNVFVTATGPASIVGQGSAFWYTVDYGNQYRANPSLTRDAATVVLTATLPADVRFVSADTPPTTVSGPVLTWELGTLAANAGGQIHIVVQTAVPAGAALHFAADIGTATPGDDPSDNHAEVDIAVVQPPDDISQGAGAMRLAIRSELDPNSQDASATNGVYLSDSATIAWPAGEVLDFTPQLRGLSFPDEPLAFPYEYRARVVGWSVAGFVVNGATRDPQAADSRGVAGCRPRAQPVGVMQLLRGCAYAYLGGASREAIASPAALSEAALTSQAHAYWTYPPAPQMRNDVSLYTLDPLESVGIDVQVEVEVWIVNAYPGDLNGMPLPEIPVVPLPDPERQLLEQTFTVNLVVPRSVIGPGSR